MGYYIDRVGDQNLPATGKAKWLMTLADAKPAELPVKFQPNLVCVVENGPFDAAGYVFSESELEAFTYPSDRRRKTWLIVPNSAKLSGYED